MSSARSYLDFNASHPLRPEARQAMVDALALVGNPSSVHAEGRKARAVVEAARRDIADFLDVDAADVVFTSGATEANAFVMAAGWDEIFLSPLEHDSVTKAARLAKGHVVVLDVTRDGVIDLDAARRTMEQSSTFGRRLLCLIAANNETGAVQPVAHAAAIAHAAGFKIFSDAVQVVGRMPLDDLKEVDFVSISAHKIGGPKGVGAIVLRSGAELPALLVGGGQERGRRAGTENVAGIAGFAAAARVARSEIGRFAAVGALRARLLSGLREVTPGLSVIGEGAPRLVNTLCVAAAGLAADAVVIQMDLAGVAISAGSACSSGKVGASAGLAAMKIEPDLQRAAVRFSLGLQTTSQDIDAAIAAWHGIAARGRVAA